MTFKPKYDHQTKKMPKMGKSPMRTVVDSTCMLIFILLVLRLVLVHEKIFIGGRIPIIDDMLEWLVNTLKNFVSSLG